MAERALRRTLRFALAALLAPACAPAPPVAIEELGGATMGTIWSVRVAGPPHSSRERAELQAEIQARLDEVERRMSSWDAGSELSRFNRHAATTPFAVSAETLEVFRVAQEVSALSGGALDVTVAPLVAAWGFGADPAASPPGAAELVSLRERVGWRRIEVDLARGVLVKQRPDVECDLSAVAQGYAVDRVAASLVALGVPSFLIEVGGEVRAGRRPGARPWRVGIESPAGRGFTRVVELEHAALATSGDYRSHRDDGEARRPHVIDPRTGRPIEHGLASVSVIAADAARADALATALLVLGPEQGLAFAEREGIAALFVERRPDGSFAERESARFPGR